MPRHDERREPRARARARHEPANPLLNRDIRRAILATARASQTRDGGRQPLRIPRTARPKVVLTVDRASAASHPVPGTLTVTEDGTRAVLHVGSVRHAAALRAPGLAARLRTLRTLEIVSSNVVAGLDARAYLGRKWKLADAAESGLLSPRASKSLRE
ncbi:hypothetical protein GXW83_27490 [Streptacidiphilus sp. PB12-B1b]|uniref:hypothetical protein n=1 Tax=Streptacidiphilus sp. PB12-B1b TaxID=2705012 RepID=UPI0015FAC7D4|nr:hypothetical protein [Streptacidiphilus sp. PB12-B1b]QMU78889.1 hypothetical protein GXW83_27490 [Streptacidiphilus sp. PB12-B1b]